MRLLRAQKAEKERESGSGGAESAETRVHDETRIELESDSDKTVNPQRKTDQANRDETYLDREETATSASADNDQRDLADETALERGQETSVNYQRKADPSNRDETYLDREETATSTSAANDQRDLADETKLERGQETSLNYQRKADPANRDETYLDREETATSTSADNDLRDLADETKLDAGHETLIEQQYKADRTSKEDTNLDREQTETGIVDSNDYTDMGEETIISIFDEDQSIVLTDDDVTSFLEDEESLSGEAETEAPDQDLSLILIDQESQEDSLDEEPKTGSLAASTEVQILADTRDTTSELNLGRVPAPGQIDDKDHTVILRADATITQRDNLDGLTKTEELGLKTQTSTRTYAPDNYDRTLVKVANEDASKLFSGMKADSDDAMTPDYAKKVFVSKFSSQRMYNYRLYSAVVFVIFLVISILGMFELQQESSDIDSVLLPLKRDPMPGAIKIASNEESSTSLFEEKDSGVVDIQTLQLVENADIAIDTDIILNRIVEPGQSPEPETTEVLSTKVEAIESNKPVDQPVVARIQPSNKVAIDSEAPKLDEPPNQQLQITTSNTISDKDQWLRQAYAAYQLGDDKTALAKYSQVIKVDPSNRNALLARAAIYIQNNNVNAAIRDYQTLLLANPKDSLAMASLMAVANYSPEVAESQLKIMIRDEPDSPYLNFALANVFGAQNRWIEAQGLYFTALENNPNDPNYAYNLAVSLEHIEKPKVAIAYYERALDNINKGLATFNRDVVDQRLEQLKQL